MNELSDIYFKKVLINEDSSLDQWHAQKVKEQEPVSETPDVDALLGQFQKLTPEQQQAFIKAITQPITKEDTGEVAALSVESLAVSPAANVSSFYGFPQQQPLASGMINKVKVVGLPSGQGSSHSNVTVGSIYKIVDRNLMSVTVIGDDGRKVVLPKHLIQFING